MKKAGLVMLCGLLATAFICLNQAAARPQYKKAFETRYEKKIKTTCNTCHVKGEKDRKKRNAFGIALDKAGLDKKNYTANIKTQEGSAAKNKKALEDFKKALEKVLKDEKNKEFKERLEKKQSPVEQ
jgi:hypothetical protein